MEDGMPVKGFVYRRKQFFSSFENLVDAVDPSPRGPAAAVVTRGAGSIAGTKDKKWRLSNADISFQQKVVTFEQYASRRSAGGGRRRQDSTASSVTSADRSSFCESEKYKELADTGGASTFAKWSSMPVLDDQVSFSTDHSGNVQGVNAAAVVKKDINGNNTHTQPSKGSFRVNMSYLHSKCAAEGSGSAVDGAQAAGSGGKGDGQKEEAKDKPHWTTVFSQRLNQIRHRFESRSKADQPKPNLVNGSVKRRSFSRNSMENLLDISDKPTPQADGNNGNKLGEGHRELAKSCASLYCDDVRMSNDNTFRRNAVRTSSSTKYKQTQNWLEKNLVLGKPGNRENADTNNVARENAKNISKETSINIAKLKESLKLVSSARPNLTDSEKEEIASNAYLAKWGPNGSLAPDILQHENGGILMSNQIFAGQVKEPVRSPVEASRGEQNGSGDVVREIQLIDKVNGHDVLHAQAVPPVLVPSQGFTSDEKVKDRATLKDWDPVSVVVIHVR